MLKIENTEVMGWEHAIRGMRNPKNSWEKSDSNWRYIAPAQRENHILTSYSDDTEFWIGPNDADLMNRLRNAGTDHRKFMRMITVYLDITAPLYWWKEFKTYRAGKRFGDDEPDIIDDGYLEYDIEMNSCSTMHKIADKEFTLDDFSHEHLNCEPYHRNWIESATVDEDITSPHKVWMTPLDILRCTIEMLNAYRESYLETKDKQDWWQMIQLLLLNGLMGLNGEAGECIDILKKHLFQGHDLDREHMAKELGDVAWYLAVSADAIGYDLETIFQMNIDKLRARYPDGFDAEHSLHRNANDI